MVVAEKRGKRDGYWDEYGSGFLWSMANHIQAFAQAAHSTQLKHGMGEAHNVSCHK